MDLLNINFDNYKEDIIKAMTEVYGSEYEEIIIKRAYDVIDIIYTDYRGIKDYLYYLITCKEKELEIKFLKNIGIDVSKYENISYMDIKNYDEDINNLLNIFINGNIKYEQKTGIASFNDLDSSSDAINKEQINILNYLRKNFDITLENYDEFKKTMEYQKLLELIKKYLEIHKEVSKEFKEYKMSLDTYSNYCNSESKRFKEIEAKKKYEIYLEIKDRLPLKLREYLEKNFEEVDKILLNSDYDDLEHEFKIEAFNTENERKSKNRTTKEHIKTNIYIDRLDFFEALKIENKYRKLTVGKYYLKSIDIYKEIANREEVKRLIPTNKLIDEIGSLRKIKHEEALKEFIYTSNMFKDIFNNGMIDNKINKSKLYSIIKEGRICLTGGINSSLEFIKLIAYGISSFVIGALDYAYIHEFIHSIETVPITKNRVVTGFDYLYGQESIIKNPYQQTKRKYERLNETITDIITMEILDKLHKKGIYMVEDEKITINPIDYNTDSILKDMVMPLYLEYNKPLLNARIEGNLNILTNEIGIDNFEELNDSLNRVDDLLNKKLKSKLKNNEFDTVVKAYYLELARLNGIYKNIKDYNKEESYQKKKGR